MKYVIEKNVKKIDSIFDFFNNNVLEFFYPEYTKNTIRYFFKTDSSPGRIKKAMKAGRLLIAYNEDKIVGVAIQMDENEGGVAFLDWLIVEKSHQNQGVASKLIELWEKESQNDGVHSLQLMTGEWNKKFYTNRGFVFMGKNPKGYYGVEDNYFYKNIQEPKEENYLK